MNNPKLAFKSIGTLIGICCSVVISAIAPPNMSFAIAYMDSPIELSFDDKRALVAMNCKRGSSLERAQFEADQIRDSVPSLIIATVRCAPHASVLGHSIRFRVGCSKKNSLWHCKGGENFLEFKDDWATLYLNTKSEVPLEKQLALIKDELELDQDRGHPIHRLFNQVEITVHSMPEDRWRLESNRGALVMVRRCPQEDCHYRPDPHSSKAASP